MRSTLTNKKTRRVADRSKTFKGTIDNLITAE